MDSEQSQRKRKRSGKASDKQLEYLVEYMTHHEDFAAGRFTGQQGRENQKRLWNSLTGCLNTLGERRDVSSWQKAWTDLKFRTRQKSSLISTAMRATGNVPVKTSLTDLEKKIMAVIGGTASLGDPHVDDSMEEPNVTFNVETMQFVIEEDDCDNDLSGSSPPNGGNVENANITDVEAAQSLATMCRTPPIALGSLPLRRESVESSSLPTSRSSSEPEVNTIFNGGSAGSEGGSAGPSRQSDSSTSRRRTSSESSARVHFSRLRDKKRHREEIAIEARNRFAEIQTQQVENQMEVARTLAVFAENDRARVDLERERIALERTRIEQERATAAAITAMASAVSELVRVLQKNDDK